MNLPNTVEQMYQEMQKLAVQPELYNPARKRVYMDVDGVLIPFLDEDVETGEAEVEVFESTGFDVRKTRSTVHYSVFAAAKLSEWSHRDDVDFVWLTSWRVNAPYALDELFNIKSVGFLPWSKKMSDYNGVFKAVAIREDQDNYPSDFVWVDDLANSRHSWDEKPLFRYWNDMGEVTHSIPEEKFLSVNTDSYKGLTEADAIRVEEWLNSR